MSTREKVQATLLSLLQHYEELLIREPEDHVKKLRHLIIDGPAVIKLNHPKVLDLLFNIIKPAEDEIMKVIIDG